MTGSYVEMGECKNTEEIEKVTTGMMKHKEMKEIDTEFKKTIDHTTRALYSLIPFPSLACPFFSPSQYLIVPYSRNPSAFLRHFLQPELHGLAIGIQTGESPSS